MGPREAWRLSAGLMHRPGQLTRQDLLQCKDRFPAAGLSTSQAVRIDAEQQQDQSTSTNESRLASVHHDGPVLSSVLSTAHRHPCITQAGYN